MNELDEITGAVGPMVLRRLNERQVVFQIHPDREDGCAAMLTLEDCEDLIGVIATVADCPVTFKGKAKAPVVADPFEEQLIARAQVTSGLDYIEDKHTGITKWLSEQLCVSAMTAGRYLKGEALPLPRIARGLAELLAWDYDEMVYSIIETSDMRHHVNQLHRYHIRQKGRSR